MNGRTVTRFKELRELFPADDPLACKVFQLCVLRDDLFLELIGISEEEIPSLDQVDRGARMLYFFRRSALTLNEIASAVNSKEYSKLAADNAGDSKETLSLKRAAREARRDLNKAREKLNYARNKPAGHVDYGKVCEVLNERGDFQGPIDVGDRPVKTMYRLASHAMFLAMIEDKGSSGEWEPAFEALVQDANESTLGMIVAIDYLVGVYLRTSGRWRG